MYHHFDITSIIKIRKTEDVLIGTCFFVINKSSYETIPIGLLYQFNVCVTMIINI